MTTPALLNNRYRVLRSLGQGGFGTTFLAEDIYLPSSRPCVIKQLYVAPQNQPNSQLLQERFQREAVVLEKLGAGSDRIPKLYAYFTEAGQFYLVQELIEGETLRTKIEREGKLSENAVRQILSDLLQVLDFVHSQGAIHRDLKPDNIILRQDGKPVLIDFGAVKEAIANPVNPANSIAIGTPGFMPPEQGAGRPTFASDLYSLGLTAVYLLTGKWPQEFTTDPQTGEILWQQQVTGINPSLAAVLDRAIQYSPNHRYTTAREMLNALNANNVNHNSTQPTVAVGQAIASPRQGANIVVPSNQGQGWKAIAIGGATIVTVISLGIFASRLNQHQSTVSPVASAPPSNSPSPTPAISNSPSPSPSTSNSPAPISSPSNSPSPNPAPSNLTSPSPSPSNSPSPIPSASNSPAVTPRPSPSTEPARSPSPSPINNSATINSIPAFPVGTPRNKVETALGKPTRDVSGSWKTRAVTYTFVPNQIDLGYLFDRNTGVLRQTELSFTQSVDSQMALKALDQLLESRITEDIKQGFQQVQQRRRSAYTFTNGSFRGQIVRQDCDFVYISIWDANLHDFEVEGARKC